MLYTTQPYDYVICFADEEYPGDTMLVEPGTVLEVSSIVRNTGNGLPNKWVDLARKRVLQGQVESMPAPSGASQATQN